MQMLGLVGIVARFALAFGATIAHDADPKFAQVKYADVYFATEGFQEFTVGVL